MASRRRPLPEAQRFWSQLTGVPVEQFHKPYRAVVDASIRHNKHERGCAHVVYGCTRTQRRILGLLDALPAAAHGSD
jgi:hypothetical protein